MSTWAERLAIGEAFEATIGRALEARGWEVSPWGQGILTETTRAALKRSSSPIRWTPDLVAAQASTAVLIDCKGSMTGGHQGRHAVSRAAVRAHLQLGALFDMPIYYVFANYGVLTPHDVVAHSTDGPDTSLGCGSPYYLIGPQYDRSFDDTFGHSANLALTA